MRFWGSAVSKQIIVLGMHRSGTSMIAGVLHHLGVMMGEDLVIGSTTEQPAGYFEDREFMHLNESILTQAGGGWMHPPGPRSIESVTAYNDKIQELIERRNSQHQVWGWKDPRTVLTLPCYLPYLSSPRLVVVRRQAKSVIQSLVIREKGRMTPEQAVKLYNEYQTRIARYAAPLGYIIIYYEDCIKYGLGEVDRLIKKLDLQPTPEQRQAAIDHIRPELKRC